MNYYLPVFCNCNHGKNADIDTEILGKGTKFAHEFWQVPTLYMLFIFRKCLFHHHAQQNCNQILHGSSITL